MIAHSLPAKAQPVPSLSEWYPLMHADLERLLAAPDCCFEAGFGAFVSHLEEAFRIEEQSAEELGADSLKEHRQLHAEILRLMHHAQARNLACDYALSRKVIRLLPEWFNARSRRVDAPLTARMREAHPVARKHRMGTAA